MRQRIQKEEDDEIKEESYAKNETSGGRGKYRRNIIDKNVDFSAFLFWLLNCGDLECL